MATGDRTVDKRGARTAARPLEKRCLDIEFPDFR
jgi:hypothetical protein